MGKKTIPIFPINSVLFPGTLVRLRVADARYKALVSMAVKKHERCFVAVLARSQREKGNMSGISSVGTLAQILHLAEDGEYLTVLAFGKERFRILSCDDSGEFPLGVVEAAPLRGALSPRVHFLETRARAIATEYFSRLLNLNEEDSANLKLPSAAVPLAHFIGANMQVSTDRRQHLLEVNELETLLDQEIHLLETELKRIQWFEAQRRLRPKGYAPFSLN